MTSLTVENISRIEDERWIVKDINFRQEGLQNIALAGVTGSGKSTLLRIIAGLAEATTGAVFFDGKRVEGPTEKLIPGHPKIAYLSQYFELRNHYRVYELLEMTALMEEKEAQAIYDVCRIQHLLKRWTNQLSGGEKQRIALARLLVAQPQLLLLDEPYSNLDPLHKTVLKDVVRDVSEHLKITCMLVSHDPLDTLSWAHQILVMNDGEVVQQGTPQTVYRQPANEYVAGLFGAYTLLTPALAKALSEHSSIEMRDIGRFVRPEEFMLREDNCGLKATVKEVRFKGSYNELVLDAHGSTVALHTHKDGFQKNDAVYISL